LQVWGPAVVDLVGLAGEHLKKPKDRALLR